MTILVVYLPFLGIVEHLVGLGEFLEFLLGGLVAGIAIRVMLKGELAIGLLDLILAGIARHI